jgi:CHAT domain-containing protein
MAEQKDYLDFEISIHRAGDGSYHAQVAALGARAENNFSDPFSQDKRQLIRQTLTTSALRSSARVRSSGVAEIKAMRDVGRSLFDQVIQGQVREFYYQCLGQATEKQRGLRLRLVLDPSLQALPWEFLCSPEQEFLGLDPQTPIVRFIQQRTLISPLRAELPLRVLVVIASPSDQLPLDTAAEKARIETALSGLEQRGLTRVTYLEGRDTWSRLIDILREDDTHILHFIGHGAYDETRNEGVLVMENEIGESKLVGSDLLSILVRGKRRLRLVLLNSCLGAAAAEAEPFSSVAAGLVRAGIPAVIAMQFEVSDRAAHLIAETFYESLALNFPVDAALTEARREIALQDRDSLEWATPVLFMQVPDGQLFNIQQRADAPDSRMTTTDRMESLAKQLARRADKAYADKDWDKALKDYQSVLSLDPDHPLASQRIAEIEARHSAGRGKPPPGRQPSSAPPPAHDRVVAPAPPPRRVPQPAPQPAAPPAMPPASVLDLEAKAAERYAAGEAALAQRDWAAAITAYQGAMLLKPDYQDAAQKLDFSRRCQRCSILYSQAQQAYQVKQYDRSLAAIKELRQLDPDWPDPDNLLVLTECGQTYHNAVLSLKARNTVRGAALLRQVLARMPNYEDAAQRLEHLAAGGDGLLGPIGVQPASLAPGSPATPAATVTPGAPATPPDKSAPRTYEVSGLDLAGLAETLRQWFVSNGYQSQVLPQGQALVVQGQKRDAVRAVLGMNYAATVVLEPAEQGIKVSVGGSPWSERAAAAAVGLFLTGVTLLTAGFGALQEAQTMSTLWQLIEQRIDAQGGKRIDA